MKTTIRDVEKTDVHGGKRKHRQGVTGCPGSEGEIERKRGREREGDGLFVR